MCTVSLCMIVKNEEDILGRCLTSAAGLVDEIIVVDTGSTDRTRSVALQYTDKVFDFTWTDNFSAARNESFSKAGMDYCMWLNAADVILEEDREHFLDLKRSLPPETDVVMMKHNMAFDEAGRPSFSYYRERLIKNLHAPLWSGAVHEAVTPFGRVVYSEVAVTHRKEKPGDPNRNLRIFEARVQKAGTLEPREQFYYACELYYHNRWEEGAVQFLRFLNEGKGWVENNIEACRFLAQCLYHQHKKEAGLKALLRSLEYDTPRAETCCDLGAYYIEEGDYRRAAFWYELVLTLERNDQSGAFVSPDCYGYLPCIQLCVCYDHLGQREKAEAYNFRAGKFKPNDRTVVSNLEYFASRYN